MSPVAVTAVTIAVSPEAMRRKDFGIVDGPLIKEVASYLLTTRKITIMKYIIKINLECLNVNKEDRFSDIYKLNIFTGKKLVAILYLGAL
jgi:hypothetical protein